jgi:hypothetical protein
MMTKRFLTITIMAAAIIAGANLVREQEDDDQGLSRRAIRPRPMSSTIFPASAM